MRALPRLVITPTLIFISHWLCGCAAVNAPKATPLAFGFLPPGMAVTSRETVPALTVQQAGAKRMHPMDAALKVMPETEVIHLNAGTAFSVIHVPSDAEALQKDYPGFAKRLPGMRGFVQSNPTAYPDPPQPDVHWVNASVYVRAKFRCLDLPWGKAIMMLAQYTQEAHPPPPNDEDLRIWIRGVSNEALRGKGGFCISANLKLTHPQLKSRDAACAATEGQDETQAIADGEKRLNSFADDSFSPSLQDIERMLREIKMGDAP